MLTSSYQDLGPCLLPQWSGRQKYMHTFNAERPVMAEGFEDYRAVVALLCAKAGHRGIAHMTVDEKIVQPGMSQRRPGAHLDGRFMPDIMDWSHKPSPGHLHYCNNIPVDRQAIIIATTVAGCVAYPGEFDGEPKSDGDLEHIRDQLGEGVLLPAYNGFLLSPDCVHESVRFSVPTKRTFLRIALES